MDKSEFKKRVKKQLWFLNPKEQQHLITTLNNLSTDEQQQYQQKPIAYANHYLRRHIFNQTNGQPPNRFLLLIGAVLLYVVLLGLFLFGLIASLASVQSFVNPQAMLSPTIVILIMGGSIILIILSLWAIKRLTAALTKKLLESKFNEK